VTPAAAAEAEGRRLVLADMASHSESLAGRGDLLIVEGAGGLLAPYGDEPVWTNAELAVALGLPILVVARMALGTINHTSLTLGELGRRRLAVAGLVLVRTEAVAGPQEPTNARFIERVTGVRPLGTLPFLTDAERADPDRIASSLAQALPPPTLETLLG
jgi:dethiobiotin synthetase